jgi:hypothetical protein
VATIAPPSASPSELEPEPGSQAAAPSRPARSFAVSPNAVLAGASAGAAAIHFGMLPGHWAEIWWHGLGFAVVAWVQLAWAWALLARPSRRLLAAGIAINVVVLGIYALSRTAGLPGGANAWAAEDVSFVDVVSLAFELVVVLGAAAVLLDPKPKSEYRVPLSAAAIAIAAVMGLTTAALASPSATQHHHHTAGDGGGAVAADGHVHGEEAGGAPVAAGGTHDHGAAVPAAQRCDLAFNTRSYYEESKITGGGAEHSHGAGGEAGPPESELAAAQKVMELQNMSDAEYNAWLKTLNPAQAGPNGDDTTMGGHLGPQHWTPLTDSSACTELGDQIAAARKVALSMPHPPDAERNGYQKVTVYVPGIGAHYMSFGNTDGTFDVDRPEMVLYDGTGPDANVIGLVYYIRKQGDVGPSGPFADQMQFHRHVGLCVKVSGGDIEVIGDSTTPADACRAMGGIKQDGSDGWMGHAWVVPGCESPWGVFSAVNPVLDGALGGKSGQGKPCSGSVAAARYDLRPGTVASVADSSTTN